MKKSLLSFLLLAMLSTHLIALENLTEEIDSFNHISITTNDLPNLLEFYRNIIGCKLLPNGGERSGDAISKGIGLENAKLLNYKLQFPNSDVILELIQMENPQSADGNKAKINSTGYTHFCLMVKDLDKTYQILKANKVKTISPPVEVKQTKAKFFYAYDPDGNIIEIVQVP
ncbi:MAG TPA: hypothetical protein DD381_06150 [Lentisphaeria bacterium]|nr:MAG: hypothetical protein A2X47_05265 [Lentisphaerae bacterium GWF2_38_69]HBM15908.1 hypothetical protein [Lentisphaeria bacterium]